MINQKAVISLCWHEDDSTDMVIDNPAGLPPVALLGLLEISKLRLYNMIKETTDVIQDNSADQQTKQDD